MAKRVPEQSRAEQCDSVIKRLKGLINASNKPTPETVLPIVKDFKVGHAESKGDPCVGCTVFLFKRGTRCVTSKLGGSVASYCTDERDLFDDNIDELHKVDAIFFSGGSLHGLSVGGGVAEFLTKQMIDSNTLIADSMYYIPRVSGAITFAGAWGGDTQWKPPNPAMGYKACESATTRWTSATFRTGQHGAGASCFCGNIDGVDQAYPGGQGYAFSAFENTDVQCFAYVVLNCKGHVRRRKGGNNTTIPHHNRFQSTNVLVHTNAKFSSVEHMQQVATQIHCSMAAEITPFACCVDGDILFLTSSENVSLSDKKVDSAVFGVFATSVLSSAIESVFIYLRIIFELKYRLRHNTRRCTLSSPNRRRSTRDRALFRQGPHLSLNKLHTLLVLPCALCIPATIPT